MTTQGQPRRAALAAWDAERARLKALPPNSELLAPVAAHPAIGPLTRKQAARRRQLLHEWDHLPVDSEPLAPWSADPVHDSTAAVRRKALAHWEARERALYEAIKGSTS